MSVTTFLKGGCANQLFQYTTGLALAQRLNTDLRLCVARYAQENEWRMYSLGLFKGITEETTLAIGVPVIEEQGMPYNPALLADAPDGCTIVGYWQTESYFNHLRTELKTRLVPKQPLEQYHLDIERKILHEGERSVALTVRRTDYVGNSFHGLLDMDYYERAAVHIGDRVNDPCFFIFTDDLPWCRENFRLPYRMVLAGNFDRTIKPHLGREDADLWLMSLCQHAIGANSSYSWWARWLSVHEHDGISIFPERWFGPSSSEDARDIVPQRWIKL